MFYRVCSSGNQLFIFIYFMIFNFFFFLPYKKIKYITIMVFWNYQKTRYDNIKTFY